ncbi:MAG: hypothetical protein N2450_09560 [bacterium]|nr:hypothetical protein [bacterium]
MNLSFQSHIPIWLIILLWVISIIIVYYWTYYKTNPNLKTSQKTFLMILRSLSFLLMLTILFSVEIQAKKFTNREFRLQILVDASESMIISDRLGNRKDKVNELLAIIESKKYFHTTMVADSIIHTDQPLQVWKNLSKTAKYSSAKRMFDAVSQDQKKIDGIVWITDGNVLEGNNIPWLKIPTWPIIVGDTLPLRNAYLQETEIPSKIVRGQKFSLNVPVVYTGDDEQKAGLKISLTDGSQIEKMIQLPSKNSTQIYSIEITSKKDGWQNLQIELLTNFDEEKDDNLQTYPIYIHTQQQSLWIIYQTLHPDIGAMKQTFSNDSSYQVNLFHMNELLDQLKKLTNHNLPILVLYGSPDEKKIKEFELAKFLKEYKGALCWISASSNLSKTLLERFENSGVTMHQTQEMISTQVTPVSMSDFSIITSDLQWSRLPPTAAWKKCVSATKNVIAVYATNEPAIILQTEFPKGVFITFWDFWRWKHDRIETGRSLEFEKMFKYLIEIISTNLTKPLQIVPPKQLMEGIPTPIEVLWYSESGSKITEGDVVLTINQEKIPIQANAKGRFEYLWKPNQTGLVKLVATATKSNHTITSDTIQGVVTPYNQELTNPKCYPQRLTTASQTGGKLLKESELPIILDSLKQVKVRDFSQTHFFLWNSVYSMLFLIMCLTIEWWYRSRVGLL